MWIRLWAQARSEETAIISLVQVICSWVRGLEENLQSVSRTHCVQRCVLGRNCSERNAVDADRIQVLWITVAVYDLDCQRVEQTGIHESPALYLARFHRYGWVLDAV